MTISIPFHGFFQKRLQNMFRMTLIFLMAKKKPQESIKHTKCSFMTKVKHNGKRVTIVTSPLPFVIPKLSVIKPHHLEKLQNSQFILAMTHSMRLVPDENLCILPTILFFLVGKTHLGNKCKK
jgi:hypothetical protein